MSSSTSRYVAITVATAPLTYIYDSQPTFNGPFKRAELLLLPQYAASDVFLHAGNWTGSRNHVLSVASDNLLDATEPLYCIVVGTISDNKAYLGKHGSFSPKFTEDAQKAKIQFTLTRPNDPDFGPDFDKAVVAFQEHQRVVSETPLQLYFLLKEEKNAMRMNFALFESKVCYSALHQTHTEDLIYSPTISI